MSRVHRFQDLEIHPDERVVVVRGERVDPGSRAFDVLLALVERRDRVVTKQELLDAAWPGMVVEENNLAVQVSSLRKVLGPGVVATVPGRGYRFVAPEVRSQRPSRGRAWALAAATAAVALAAAVVIALRWTTPSTRDAGDLSVAVLPFENRTGDPGASYISDGLAASVASDLARARDLFVAPAMSAFAQRGNPNGVRGVSQALGVRFVLQGQVQRSGERLHVEVQLADGHSGRQLWSDALDGTVADILALQDRVTARVVNSIRRDMVLEVARSRPPAAPGDATVGDLMLHARALGMMGPLTPERHAEIARLYREILAKDPQHVEALVSLSLNVANWAMDRSYLFSEAQVREMVVEARELAIRARSIDPGHPGVYRPIAIHAAMHGDFEAAQKALRTALALDPRNPAAYNYLAANLMNCGEPAAALQLLVQAIELNPKRVSMPLMANRGRAHLMLGEPEAAIEWLSKALQMGDRGTRPPRVYLAMALTMKGRNEEARVVVQDLLRISPGFRRSEFEKPKPWSPEPYKAWFEQQYLPWAERAGLPD